jgi:hypothetical protein
VYNYLIPHSKCLSIWSPKFPRGDGTPTRHLEILRVNKTIHDEVTKHCLNQQTLLLRAGRQVQPQYRKTLEFFTRQTTTYYAERISNMSFRIRDKITQLEIQILPTRETWRENGSQYDLDPVSLRQICDALPNLTSILLSYPQPDTDSYAQLPDHPRRAPHRNHNPYDWNSIFTLEWVHYQLRSDYEGPRYQLRSNVGGPRILWDLTYYRPWAIYDVELLRKTILQEQMMKEMIEETGRLELAQSVTASQEDVRRWMEIQHVVLEAVNLRQNG